MGKRDKRQTKESRNPKKRSIKEYIDPQDMDDEIDTFHKQRDIISLDIDDRVGESGEDDEEPVFDDKAINDDDDSDEDDEDNFQDTGFAAKIARQIKFLEQKFGKLDDEMDEDEGDEEKEKEDVWDGRVHQYYGADTRGFEGLVSQQRAAKRAAKAAIYTRTSTMPSLPETVEGKRRRRISYQIEKNKGLTPSRPKSVKNPRKKYREKHRKQQMRRKGQVRQIRKPIGSYCGEASGINPGISRSIRFNY